MNHPERLAHTSNCPACGHSLEPLASLELALVHQELTGAHGELSRIKPALITASYYLSQYAHYLHDSLSGALDAADLSTREAQVRLLSRDLMDAYGRAQELLSIDAR